MYIYDIYKGKLSIHRNHFDLVRNPNLSMITPPPPQIGNTAVPHRVPNLCTVTHFRARGPKTRISGPEGRKPCYCHPFPGPRAENYGTVTHFRAPGPKTIVLSPISGTRGVGPKKIFHKRKLQKVIRILPWRG